MSDAAITSGPRPWWERRVLVAVLILLAAVPLLYPALPPLVDLPGHMGRFRVQLDLAHSPLLQRYYHYHWALIGNLGVDLLIVPFAKLFGLEFGTKLIVLPIPPLTVAGFLWVAREVHGRIPPTALFAVPFTFGHPFMFGFVNFALSMALAFLAFGLWLRLARLGRLRLRAMLFVPISVLLWVVHTYGWGLLGLLAFSAEAVRQHDRGRNWFMAGVHGAAHASVMALPIVMTLYWQSGDEHALARGWFDFKLKWRWIKTALRDRWELFDRASVAMIAVLFALVLFHRRMTFSRNLLFTALILIGVYLLLPRIIFGSAYADMRMVPFIFAVVILSMRFKGATHLPTARFLGAAGLLFLLVRLAGNSLSLGLASREMQRELAAFDHLPDGARVLFLAGRPCGFTWELPRKTQLGALLIVRKQALVNSEWRMPGAQLLSVRDRAQLGWFAHDPSQQVLPDRCGNWEHWPISNALARFPRDKFDYVWMVDAPAHVPSLTAGWQTLYRDGTSVLYRIRPAA